MLGSLFFFFTILQLALQMNNRPIIGIFSIPSDCPDFRDPNQWSYIQNNYVQYLQSAGAQIIPIPWDLPLDQLTNIFSKINGILFTGGDTALWDIDPNTNVRTWSKFTKQAEHLLNLTIKANAMGDYFPIWGTCQGLELIIILMTQDLYILDTYVQSDKAGTVIINNQSRKATLFNDFEPELLDYMQNNPAVWYYHEYGVNPDTFGKNMILNEMFEILGISNDTNNKTFVALLEHKYFPIFLTQFHPERNGLDWFDSTTVPHSPNSVLMSIHMANEFVDQCRANNHYMSKKELNERVIENYPTYIVPHTGIPTYYFYKASSQK